MIGPNHHDIEGFSSNPSREESDTTFVVRKRLHPVLRDDIFKSASVMEVDEGCPDENAND